MVQRVTPRILIIAGSDSGGGAGIQADIKTVTMLGGHAMTAITAITAQNTLGVQAVMAVPAEMVIAQIASCVSDIGVDAVKIGMIGSAETAHAVADYLSSPSFPRPREPGFLASDDHQRGPRLRGGDEGVPIVFDPVMVATSGDTLADADTIAAFERLMRLASVVTPNVPELVALGGEAAVLRHGCHLVAKGGHAAGDWIVDRLLGPTEEIARVEARRLKTDDTHGTGCTLASALACGLGAGLPVAAAFRQAVRFVRSAILQAPRLGQGHGPLGQQFVTDVFDA